MGQYGYYPGCSISSSAREYDRSTRAVCATLGIHLTELPDWNCCGASSAHSLSKDIDLALSARNIGIAHRLGLDMVVPCAACYNRTMHAWQTLRDDPEKRAVLQAQLGFDFRADLQVYHLLQVMEQHLAHLKEAAAHRLPEDGVRGRRVACYYGCLITRPRGINPHEDMEYPEGMGRMLAELGYQPLRWSFATECCGAALSLVRGDVVRERVDRIIAAAREAGAEAVVTACPLCQLNLESRQSDRFPVFYFTELLGVALGLPETEKWWRLHLINPVKGLPQRA